MNNKSLIGPLGISLIAIIVVAIALIVHLPPLVAAMIKPTANQADHHERVKLLVDRHAAETALFRDRFEGRSPFFIPDAPPPLPPEPTEPPPTPVQVDKGPHPNYGGSIQNPTAILGDTVFFKDGSDVKRMKPGEVQQGVRLVEIKPPYTVVVAWTAPSTPTARYEEGTYELQLMQSTLERDGGPISLTPPDAANLPRGITEAEAAEEDRAREERKLNPPPHHNPNDDFARQSENIDDASEFDDGLSAEERQQLQEQEREQQQEEVDDDPGDDLDAEPMPDD